MFCLTNNFIKISKKYNIMALNHVLKHDFCSCFLFLENKAKNFNFIQDVI